MNTASLIRTRRVRMLAAAGTIAITALALTGCEADSTGAASAGDSTSTAAADSELATSVAALEKPLDAYPVPTEPVSDVSGAKGKVFYYIPVTSKSPQFAVTQKTLTAALDSVGATVQVCDGEGTPTAIGACITQGTQAQAAAIITDAIPYGIGQNAFDAAQAAGIPVIISNQVIDDKHPASDTLAYIPAGGSAMQEALAKWITLDSGAAADVLINQGTDGPAPAVFVAAGQAVYDSECPDCTITINEVSSANQSLIPSSTSSALLKNPDITYVESQFQQYLQPTQEGVQQSGVESIKGVTGSVLLGGLQQLQAKNFLYAAAGQAAAFQGWVDADAALRLIAGVELPEYSIPVRLFTQDTIADVTLTEEAELSGEWYGPTDFPEQFSALWGVK
ncbi:sugar ABC transporter substrate-binding protein [Leifsonia flava]|nr:substrate-binding domain-containing protein [Leifsonia flava]